VDLASLRLDVYESRDGWWNPEHDVVVPPQDWEFLATGQAFVTRSVKAAGVFWLAWAPRSRTRQHRRLLGLWAPAAAIQSARRSEADTASARAARREAGARSRARQEARYQDELAEAIVEYLHFAPRHEALAQTIARRPPSAPLWWAAVGWGAPASWRSMNALRWQRERRSATHTPTTMTGSMNSWSWSRTTNSTETLRPKPMMLWTPSSTPTDRSCPDLENRRCAFSRSGQRFVSPDGCEDQSRALVEYGVRSRCLAAGHLRHRLSGTVRMPTS
jgi:hypothetical protein